MSNSQFVVDGRFRAIAAIEPAIRAEVASAFAEQLQAASLLQHLRLKRMVASEIRRRVEAVAPCDALY